MNASTSRRRNGSRGVFEPEILEGRTLLSAWGTVDSYQLAPGKSSYAVAMATDAAGNVYAAGLASDSSGHSHGIIREKLAGSASWTTIEDYTVASTSATGGAGFSAIALDGAGDVYVAGNTSPGTGDGWVILERPAGSAAFSVVDSVSSGNCKALAIDQAGNVFAAGSTWGGKGNKNTNYWTVRKQTGGQGVFSTVDSSISSVVQISPAGMTTIVSGASAGLYVVGLGPNSNWLVRKSIDAGASWTTVDSFVYPSGHLSRAYGVAGDGAGNLYAVGFGFDSSNVEHYLTRKSTNGGASWTTVDDFRFGAASPNIAEGVGTDLVGNVYTVGVGIDAAGIYHDLVRSNAGGSWNTVDDLSGGGTFRAFTADAAGNLYAAGALYDGNGTEHWTVQSTAGPAAPTMATAASVFSATQIASTGTVTDLLHLHKINHRRT